MTEEQLIRDAAGEYYDVVQLYNELEHKYHMSPTKEDFCNLQMAYKTMKDAEANLRRAQGLST